MCFASSRAQALSTVPLNVTTPPLTIVMVTHNMAQARRISDECLFMLLGEVLEHASTTNIFLNPVRKETEAYVEGRFG